MCWVAVKVWEMVLKVVRTRIVDFNLFGVIFVYCQMSDKGQLLMINGYTWNRFVLYFWP